MLAEYSSACSQKIEKLYINISPWFHRIVLFFKYWNIVQYSRTSRLHLNIEASFDICMNLNTKKPIQLIGKTLSKMRIGDCSTEF